ncbi:Aminoglycoside phosphotransferase [Metarhizium brunneum]
MASTIPLLDHESVTFEEAKNLDFNVIHRHNQVALAKQLYHDLWSHRESIATITKKQLGLDAGAECSVALPQDWIRGKFNVCIPIEVKSRRLGRRVLMRCPMPFALRDSASLDEKLRGEVGAYLWMQEHCPDIRIPQLYGFSTSNGHFTHEARLPWYMRLRRIVLRLFRSVFQHPALSSYAPMTSPTTLPTQYMLLDYIGQDVGQMLSSTWNIHRHDPSHRNLLFHGLARIMISLARIPQPRIGSFRFHDDCTVTLTNRPSFAATALLENWGAEPSIDHEETYCSTESYVADMITLHDNYFYSNESAADDEHDCRAQMAIRTMLRTLSHNYIKREYRNGPFLLQLTDLHQSNVFVDDDWNITCLLDLEWLCALPPEALSAPYWFTGRSIDGIVDNHEGQNLTEYDGIRKEFMRAFSEEESRFKLVWPLSRIMEEMWQSKGTWFWHSLESVNGAYYLVYDHLVPQFSESISGLDKSFALLWRRKSQHIVEKKISDFNGYTQKLGRLYTE